MNPLRSVCLLMGIFALVCAGGNSFKPPMNMHSNSLMPTKWISSHELESMPSFDEISFQKLEQMSVEQGADMLNKMYHMAQIKMDFEPSFIPKASEISVHMYTPNKQRMKFKLNEFVEMVMEQKYFDNQEVTIFITGLPQESETVMQATQKLVEAYMQRYNSETTDHHHHKHDYESVEKSSPSSSEETFTMPMKTMIYKPSANFVLVDLGSTFPTFKTYATMDIEETGVMIGDMLVQLTNKADVSHELIHVIGSNIGAHVAGAAGRQYIRQTGHQLRRITGLDPSKIYTHRRHSLTGLARGDAEFVDVIHTSAYGMGTATRHGNADFYPNGPSAAVPGTDNVVEASMRAIRYYAESVMPGNERNFPAKAATSMEVYKNQHNYGKRVYMGFKTDYDVEGDFILEVNVQSPYGRWTTVQRQQRNHSMHMISTMVQQNKDY